MPKTESLKILIAATEVTPYAKSGGLGDVIGSLPKALKDRGVDVRVVFPKYRSVRDDHLSNLRYVDSFAVTLAWRRQSASIYLFDGDVPMYMIQNDYYFGRDGFYGYGDDYERFAFFSKATVELMSRVDFQADVVHFNDWQTGLGSLYLKDVYGGFVFYQNMKSLFTIHNLRYQGVFGREVLGAADLNDGYFTQGKLEFYNRVSYLKAGLVYADAVNTVSRTYAKEIQTGAYGYGMDGLMRDRSDRLFGIVNGIDSQKNDPASDPRLFQNFTDETLSKKKENKKQLQAMLGLPSKDAPMISIVSRLVDQKGMDLVAVALEELMGMDIQLVVLGTGDGRYEHLFLHNAWRFPDKLSANITFNGDLAQKIYAASDIFLMPSLFEPCGLGQLFAMRYGSVPIVRGTGGLADTVSHFDEASGTGTGFVFTDYLASGMMWAVYEALRVYANPAAWERVVKNGMACDFSWDKSAEEYVDLYLRLKNNQL
ncbi:MAG: glycogen synthase GlgA [Clostridiales bacterium]|jgi:starch synthase|nr:glycogen synthase GlgA [Clostridiales bacterium]